MQNISSLISCIIPTSPIPRHPDTGMIEKTIESIRFHIPDSRIYIMCDGIRPNVEFRRAQYEEYKIRLIEKCTKLRANIHITLNQEYSQQAIMMRKALDMIDTPYVLFCEHDGELVTTNNPRDGFQNTLPVDCKINWQDITDLLGSGGANFVRFYAWERIVPEHYHLMRGQMIQGSSKFIQTVQYSQWPHIANCDFYRKMLSRYVAPQDRKMIEIAMYGPVVEAPWEQFRVVIYYPEPNARRFYHRNGRADENGVQDPVDWS